MCLKLLPLLCHHTPPLPPPCCFLFSGQCHLLQSLHVADTVWTPTLLCPPQESAGCTELCADGTPFILRWLGWQGAQTLPRVITYDPEAQALLFNPASELEALRQGALAGDTFTLPRGDGATAQARVILREVPPAYTSCNTTSNGSATTAEAQLVEALREKRLDSVFRQSPSGRRQIEVQAVFALMVGRGAEQSPSNNRSGPWPFEVAVTLLTGEGGTGAEPALWSISLDGYTHWLVGVLASLGTRC
jgi:hypothetical protein